MSFKTPIRLRIPFFIAIYFYLILLNIMAGCSTGTDTPTDYGINEFPDITSSDSQGNIIEIDSIEFIDSLRIEANNAIDTAKADTLNNSVPNPDLPKEIFFLKIDNPNLFQDIVFKLGPDSIFISNVSVAVDLNNITPSFDYSGTVSFHGHPLISGETSINLSNEGDLDFNGTVIPFHITRVHTLPSLHIETINGQEISSKTDYVYCNLKLDAKNQYEDYHSDNVQIRQRGNSTRIFYDKKPYRIKLPAGFGLLGMKKDRDWVLLANYRDPTNFMNAIAFDMARYMNMPYTNSNRFVELYLNQEYLGMYQLTEQVEQGDQRVAVDGINGLLLNLDLDDGHELAPEEINNFESLIYKIPVAVKHPEIISPSQITAIQADFAELELLIQEGDYHALAMRLDIASFIDFLIIQELTRNVELVSPRSMYMYRTSDHIYHFGPVWDFDGGFAFDWASMTTGHNYFGSQSWIMGSTNPSQFPSDAYDQISGFFVNMFNNPEFRQEFNLRWLQVYPGILNYCFNNLNNYAQNAATAMANNATRWPIDKDYNTEITRMKMWLTLRSQNFPVF
jgi:hypothetical protein